jgi:ribose transport system substrate-binding protein
MDRGQEKEDKTNGGNYALNTCAVRQQDRKLRPKIEEKERGRKREGERGRKRERRRKFFFDFWATLTHFKVFCRKNNHKYIIGGFLQMMKMFRLALLLVLTGVLCGGAYAAPYKVTLITMDQMDRHWAGVDEGAQKAAKELGNVTYNWTAPDVKDDVKQIEFINNAVAAGAQAILLAANGPDAVTEALKEAVAAGVKIIYVDSPANFPAVATFSTNNETAGTTAGKELLKALEAAGVKEGRIGIVNVNAATASTVAREKGFRAAFEGSKFSILETQYGEGDVVKSKEIADNFITQGVVGLFGANEGSTTGVGNAIQEAGGKVVGVGFDTSDALRELIKQGYLIGTMAQNPSVMGYEGVKAAVNVLEGKNVSPDPVDTGVTVLTKDKL